MLTTTWTPLTPNATVSVATSIVTTYDSGVSFVQDTFSSGVQGSPLDTRVGEGGAVWSQRSSLATGVLVITNTGRCRPLSVRPNGSFYYASGLPLGADYRVIADITKLSALPLASMDIVARISLNTDTRYGARYSTENTPGWTMYKVVGGTSAALGSQFNDTIPDGTTRQMELRVRGSDIQLLVDGTSRISVTDSSITLPGVVGVGGVNIGGTATDSTGLAMDNFNASTLTSVSTSTVVTQTASAVPAWTAQSAASTGWTARSGASTAWSTL